MTLRLLRAGTSRTGWLRTGDASAFTAAVLAEVARRLLHEQGQPGAYTPAALFGASLAEDCGGQFHLDGHLNGHPDHLNGHPDHFDGQPDHLERG